MKKLLFLIVMLVGITTQAQTKKLLIADETWFAESKTTMTITTSNETISDMIVKEFNSDITRLTVVRKKDRKGFYLERTIVIKQDRHNDFVSFINKLNKK